jgi:hypothetical protein
MAISKNCKTEIEISGAMSPSVAKAVGLSVKELYKINAAYATITAAQRKANLAANGLPPALQKTTVEITKATRASQALATSFKRIGEFAAGELIARGFEKALGFAERIADKVKEFGSSSLEVRGTREVLQNQIKSMANSIGNPELASQLDDAIRNAEGRTTPRKYSELMEIGAQLISSNAKRFGTSSNVMRES